MIICYTGLPGMGKSYALAHRAYQAIKDGRKVYSNIYIRGANKLEFDDLVNCRFPRDSMIIIDESGRHFNSRNWKNLPEQVFDMFTLHRHLGLDMIIAAQDFSYIDAQLRKVIELTYWADKIAILPFIRIYKGYYALEKLGRMGQADRIKIIFTKRRVWQSYNPTAMASVFDGRKMIKDVEWKGPRYKSRFEVFWQYHIRIRYKAWKLDRRFQNKLINDIDKAFEENMEKARKEKEGEKDGGI